LLLGSHGKLVPDVHPITVLAIDALTSDLNLNLSNELLTREIEPAGIDTTALTSSEGSDTHKLVDFRKCDLQVSAVSKITVS
jgi:hypothetical protein